MSAEGMVDVRGVRARVRRSVQDLGGGSGGATKREWRDGPQPFIRILLEEVTAEKAQRIWGLETVATFRGTVRARADVKKLDGLIVSDGKFRNERFRVQEDPRGSELGPQLLVLGLQKVNEAFDL